eukprot:CAMPEP_0180695908 /NCGR_PEP_ID=MMETSP1038_2-20121128/2696_1 /TAXON_ID=632150 /ORGANISM="Azadinium spinosum, Strain 3D9" /LENGTH=89 /DNA_ID=CAMNT_0022727351 /DNA_START=1060 /DNA_END=1325 /DNA_ORIENTATION=+
MASQDAGHFDFILLEARNHIELRHTTGIHSEKGTVATAPKPLQAARRHHSWGLRPQGVDLVPDGDCQDVAAAEPLQEGLHSFPLQVVLR